MKKTGLISIVLVTFYLIAAMLAGCGGGGGSSSCGGTSPTPTPTPTSSPTQGNWSFQNVDSEAFQCGDLQFNASGQPCISYSKGSRDDYRSLKFATYNGAQWLTETIDDDSFTAPWASLDFDEDGNPCILYTDRNGDGTVRFAWYDGAAWNVEDVATNAAGSSFRFDFNGDARCVYHDKNSKNLIYAKRLSAGNWTTATVVSNCNIKEYTTMLFFDYSGNPWILYIEGSAQTWAVKLAFNQGSGWEFETVVSDEYITENASLAFDLSGNPHVAYGQYTDVVGFVEGYYASRGASGWTSEMFHDKAGADPFLAFNASGNPCIISTNNYQWMIYSTKNGSWSSEDILSSTSGSAVGVRVLRFKSGIPYAAFDQLSYGLRFAGR